ncbi:MAG TPA: TetR family transcriptional regulator [Longimicrobiales bacterium]|nr:TetR family transcriptional regulator [Longimicrobiales bacterium]
MSTSIPYEQTGRRAQKARTRAALIEAARGLLADGATPTVEEAAAAASVSRATAYRYFPTRAELLVAAHPEIEAVSLLGAEQPRDPEARLDAVVTGLVEIFLGSEESYRAMLRLSLLPDPAGRGELALRKGRRYLWIEEALGPVRDRLTPEEFRRLVHAVSVNVGIEALVTLVDLAGLSRQQAADVMRWSARSLLRAALAGGGSDG